MPKGGGPTELAREPPATERADAVAGYAFLGESSNGTYGAPGSRKIRVRKVRG